MSPGTGLTAPTEDMEGKILILLRHADTRIGNGHFSALNRNHDGAFISVGAGIAQQVIQHYRHYALRSSDQQAVKEIGLHGDRPILQKYRCPVNLFRKEVVNTDHTGFDIPVGLPCQQQKCLYEVGHLHRCTLNLGHRFSNSFRQRIVFQYEITGNPHHRQGTAQFMTHIAGELTFTRDKVVDTLHKVFERVPQNHDLPIRPLGKITDVEIRAL